MSVILLKPVLAVTFQWLIPVSQMDYMEMIQAIYDQYVLTSPTFDPEAQKRREEWDRQIEEEARCNSDYVHAMLAQRAKENLPKCPTCGSTNIT